MWCETQRIWLRSRSSQAVSLFNQVPAFSSTAVMIGLRRGTQREANRIAYTVLSNCLNTYPLARPPCPALRHVKVAETQARQSEIVCHRIVDVQRRMRKLASGTSSSLGGHWLHRITVQALKSAGTAHGHCQHVLLADSGSAWPSHGLHVARPPVGEWPLLMASVRGEMAHEHPAATTRSRYACS